MTYHLLLPAMPVPAAVGQGSQFVGMGKDLYDNNALAKELFDKADEILVHNLNMRT